MQMSLTRRQIELERALEIQIQLLRSQMAMSQLASSNALSQTDRSPIMKEPQIKKADMGPWEKLIYHWWFYMARRHWKRTFKNQQKYERRKERKQRRQDIKEKGWNDFYKWRNIAKSQQQQAENVPQQYAPATQPAASAGLGQLNTQTPALNQQGVNALYGTQKKI